MQFAQSQLTVPLEYIDAFKIDCLLSLPDIYLASCIVLYYSSPIVLFVFCYALQYLRKLHYHYIIYFSINS